MANLRIETIVVGPLEENCHVLACAETGEALIVDPGGEPERLIRIMTGLGVRPVAVCNTHGHLDHTAANADVSAHFDVPIWIHEADLPLLRDRADRFGLAAMLGAKPSPEPSRLLRHGERFPLGRATVEVIHTPGHTPGGICLLAGPECLTGDTLFAEAVGRTDLPGGNGQELLESIRDRLLVLPDETRIHPGHGPTSTIGHERRDNPFLADHGWA